jgi:hypothetical protein
MSFLLVSGLAIVLKRMATVILVAAALAGCKPQPNSGAGTANSAPSSASGSFVGPGNVIPVGRVAVDVMEYGVPQRALDLSKRQQQAIRQDPKWWNEHVGKVKPGQPIPYDARMGMTQAEYDELQVLSKKTATHKKADATITVTGRGNDVYVLDGGPSLPDLTGIEIDLKNGVVRTPFGVTGKYSPLTMPDTNPIGAWSGIRWKFEAPGTSADTGTTVSLSIGRLKASGRGLLYYYLKKLTPPEEKRQVGIILNYDLPAQ